VSTWGGGERVTFARQQGGIVYTDSVGGGKPGTRQSKVSKRNKTWRSLTVFRVRSTAVPGPALGRGSMSEKKNAGENTTHRPQDGASWAENREAPEALSKDASYLGSGVPSPGGKQPGKVALSKGEKLIFSRPIGREKGLLGKGMNTCSAPGGLTGRLGPALRKKNVSCGHLWEVLVGTGDKGGGGMRGKKWIMTKKGMKK